MENKEADVIKENITLEFAIESVLGNRYVPLLPQQGPQAYSGEEGDNASSREG